MSPDLQDLLLTMRQHPAFREFLDVVKEPEPLRYQPSRGPVQDQGADWIYRSGRRAQHELWRSFLTDNAAPKQGHPFTSQTEKS